MYAGGRGGCNTSLPAVARHGTTDLARLRREPVVKQRQHLRHVPGRFAYVVNGSTGTIDIIDVALQTTVFGSPITTGLTPGVYDVAITPDGRKAGARLPE